MHIDLSTAAAQQPFVVDLEPPAHLLEQARDAHGTDYEAVIHLLFTKHNRVMVQMPIVQAITEPIDKEILHGLNYRGTKPPTFLIVSTTLGCLPDPACRFTWLRLETKLGSELTERDLQPIVCQLYPTNQGDQIKVIRNIEVTSQLGLKIGVQGVNVELPTSSHTSKEQSEYDTYHYRVTTFGKNSSKAVWDFRATEVHPEIAGDFTLLLIAAIQPDLATMGEISVSAQVQLNSALPKFPLIMKRSSENAVRNSFKLEGGKVS